MSERGYLGEFEHLVLATALRLKAGWMGEPDSKRGGRPKRFVEVTPSGVRALAEHREALLRVWEGLEATLGDA